MCPPSYTLNLCECVRKQIHNLITTRANHTRVVLIIYAKKQQKPNHKINTYMSKKVTKNAGQSVTSIYIINLRECASKQRRIHTQTMKAQPSPSNGQASMLWNVKFWQKPFFKNQSRGRDFLNEKIHDIWLNLLSRTGWDPEWFRGQRNMVSRPIKLHQARVWRLRDVLSNRRSQNINITWCQKVTLFSMFRSRTGTGCVDNGMHKIYIYIYISIYRWLYC